MSEKRSTRLVQIFHPEYGRRTALVYGEELHLLATFRSVHSFAIAAIETGYELRDLLSTDLSGIVLDYREVYAMRSAWSFLPSFDHPEHPSRCHIAGCGFGGPRESRPLVPPFFTKGNGIHIRGHGETIEIPEFALSGSEEAEVAAVFVIGPDRLQRRVGFTPGNEFADVEMATRDPRLLAHAKMRSCSIGPELVLDAEFEDLHGSVAIERQGQEIWSGELVTGESHAAFSIAETESAYFQYESHRIPGDAHIVYLGGSISSHKDGIKLEDGDQCMIRWDSLGKPLRNTVKRDLIDSAR